MDTPAATPIKLDEFWAYQVVVLADQISRYTLDVVRSEADLNQSQWRVLAAVADKPGRSAAEVTSVTPMDKTIVSRAVASLIKDGLIKRTPNKNDKRIGALQMTEIGTARYARISEKLAETLNAVAIDGHPSEDFNADLKHFSRYMSTLAQEPKP